VPLYQLPSVSVNAGGSQNVLLKDLPIARRGRIPHVRRFIFDIKETPTFTTAPTVVGDNNTFTSCDFWDGRMLRFIGGFNAMRGHERYVTGRVRLPDADTATASGTQRTFRRVLHLGPPENAGGLADFMIPTSLLQTGELRVVQGQLTDQSADTTARTGTVRVYADLELTDQLTIPPAYQIQKVSANSADVPLPGRALYVGVYAFASTSFVAWTAGQIGNVRLDLGAGDVVENIPAQALSAAYMDDWQAGTYESFVGDPATTDTDHKKINRASSTALTAGDQDLQAILWPRLRQKLSKHEVAETAARLSWDGSQASALIYVLRILPQTPNVVSAMAAAALTAIGRQQRDIKVKTLSKKPYAGPLIEFMPWTVKV